MTPPLYFLDTNSCIYLVAQTYPSLSQRVEKCQPGSIVISALVYAELAFGFSKLGDHGPTLLGKFIEVIPVVPFEEAAAEAYARIPFKRGKLDRLIAAHALALGLTLVTNNESDFGDIVGLKVENWVHS